MPFVRQLLLVIVLGAIAYGAYEGWQRYFGSDLLATEDNRARRGGPVLVEAAAVERTTMATTMEAVGSTLAHRSIEIVPRADGIVEDLTFESGHRVEKGDVLAKLDSNLQEAGLAEAKAQITRIEQELERARSLTKNRVLAQSQLDEIISRQAVAEAALVRARQNLADREIAAPFAGTTGISRVDVGSRVTENTVITTLDDLSSVEIEFFIPEQLYAVAEIGQPVTARTAAYPNREFKGELIEIDSRIDPASRSFKARAGIPNPDRALPSGMFMRVTMELSSNDVVTVPEEAIIAEAESAYVFLVRDGKVERREIRTGRRQVGFAEVLEGLEPGSLVVTRGINKLRDGAEITLASEPEKQGRDSQEVVTQ